MGIARGPNIVKDNLVFGYDTGYGVADNTTTTRFYPGESTENLVGNSTFIGTSGTQTQGVSPANWLFSGETGSTGFQFYNSDTSPIPLKFPNEGAVITTGSGPNNRRIYFRREDLLGNTTYTLSCWMYFSSGFSSSWSKFQYDSSNTSTGGGYFDNFADYASANGYGLDEWFLWKGTLTTEATTAKCYWGPVISSGANVLVGMQRMQVEVKGHVTPFVNGTRSSTQSLIDLKRTTDIDVSNISFDSTGQPTFDGTDDIIELNRLISTSNYSAEFIFKADVNTSGTEHWLGSQYPGTGRVIFDLYTNNRLRNFINGTSINGATTINTGTWYHAVFTRDSAGAAKIYLNGVQDATGTLSTAAPVNDNFEIGGSTTLTRWLTGDIPIAKVYNQVLTAEEVQQNFNAYKNRFNI